MTVEMLDHAADLRVRVRAPDLHTLFAAAVDLVGQLAVGDAPVEDRDRRIVELEAADESERFFRFVRELIFLYDVDGFVPGRLVRLTPTEVAGEVFDPRRHTAQHQAKALTRHRYEFRSTEAGYDVEMVFDL